MKQTLDIKRIDMPTAIYEGRPRTKSKERDEAIDKIKSIVSTKGYVVEALVEKNHYKLVSISDGDPVQCFWFDDDNKIRCAPGVVHSLQILGLNPILEPTPSKTTLCIDTLVGTMIDTVNKYGYSVFDANEPNTYMLRKDAGLRSVSILVWFDDNNQLRCTRPNVEVLQNMGLNPIAEAEHKTAPAPSKTTSALDTQVGGSHYKDMKIQPWAVMRATFTRDEMIGYHVGTVMAYLMRHKAKGGEQDIKKAQHHLTELVEYLNAA